MKKINIGLVLICLTLISLTIYIVNEENSKVTEKEKILTVLKEYIKIHNKYSMLEEEYRDINKTIDSSKYNDYLTQMKSDLSKYIAPENLDEIYEDYKARLDKQVKGLYVVKEYEKQFKNFLTYKKNGQYISVLIMNTAKLNRDERSDATFNEKTNSYEGKVTNLNTFSNLPEQLVFKKIENEYKIVMHHLADIVLGYKEPTAPMGGLNDEQ